MEHAPLFTNDAIVLGLLLLILAIIFKTSNSKKAYFVKFYKVVPPLLLCYFLPALLNWPLGLISGSVSNLYFVASRYLLPASLTLLCISIDFKSLINLGPKALIMFLAGTLGIVVGGPAAIGIVGLFSPETFSQTGEAAPWRGLATVAGSWIGGGANQAAMKEVYKASDTLFAAMIVVDVVVANIWMGFLLYGASVAPKLDKWLKADSSAISNLKQRLEDYAASVSKIPTTTDLFLVLAVGFGATAMAHFGADVITPITQNYAAGLTNMGLTSLLSPFFWLIVLATGIGVVLSFTKARQLQGVGAGKVGSVFIYILVATIGMKMNLSEVGQIPMLFIVGIIWMIFHVLILLLFAKLTRSPFFFVAVGSQANVGGAASAPVVASAFSPALAPVGVLLAVVGYALGTYGAIICAELMRAVSGIF